ncbi:ComEC/Rec2 family competence protein [Candidatus Saccharibacteria bacterium]|nr:ComEC/Rec2 family competence protein [Candidatus Saccharibacteria bacterium]
MKHFRRTTLITAGCVSVLAGLGLARKVNFEPQLWLLISLPLLLLFHRKNIVSLLLIVLLGLSLGLWRGGVFMDKVVELRQLAGQKVTIEVTATSDSIYGQRSQLEFTASRATLLQGETLQNYNKPLAGSFRISGFGEPIIYRGDKVQISGKLFPTRGSAQARISFGQLKRVGADTSWINSFTRRFAAGMRSALPEPNASFGLGILIGQRNTLPQELTNQLIMVGLVHIVAVSGYNLTILVRAVGRFRLGSKYQKLAASLLLIGIFILITGFAASIVRAAIISILSLWAWYYGRKIRPVLIIAFAAALTGLANPFYVWGDLGWYLSFLAFFGVLMIAPLAAHKLFKRQPKLLGMVVLETLAAEVMTLPLIMMSFNQLSLIGLVANALVVPLVPFAMLFAAMAATAGMLIPAVAGWFAWPANLLLTYILDVARGLAGIPGIFLHRTIGTAQMIGLYVLLAILTLTVAKSLEGKTFYKRSDPRYSF